MEKWAHHIQLLLADELDQCKGKEDEWVERHVKIIQEAYQDTHKEALQPVDIDKGKQKEGVVQDKEVFLYKPYNTSSKPSRPKIPEPVFIQEEVNNLEKALKTLQLPINTVQFYPPPHYKTLWRNREQDKQYWKEIAAKFIKQKHNLNTSRWGLLIEMNTGGPPHEPFFIALTLQEEIVIGPINKLVALYMVGDLAFLN